MKKNYNLKNIGKGVIVAGVTLAAILCSGKEAKATNSFILRPNSIVAENILKDIKNGKIDSYQNLIERTDTLSESQKLVLLSATGDTLGRFNYTPSKNKVAPQDVFFYKLQDSLETGNQNPLGECNHIASHQEIFANDIGIKAAAVTGAVRKRGHMYNIAKLKDKNVVVDYGDIFVTDTKNIEKTLEAYQKYRGTTVFKHLFYEDTEFKYKLITKDGKHFLDFVEYDGTSEPMKDLLLYGTEENANSKISLNYGNYAKSLELNNMGVFGKAGNIQSDSSSPTKNIKLVQGGYKRKFSILDFINVGGNINLVDGVIYQDNDSIIPIEGLFCDGDVSLNNETFNFAIRASRGRLTTNERVLSYDYTIGAGASYKILDNIEPYVTAQYSDFPSDSGTEKYKMRLSESRIGTLFDIPKINLLIEPYYLKRIWEEEVGVNTKFGNENFGISAGGYATKSNYDFCPDKNGFNIGLYKNFKNYELWSKYEMENSNYDNEIEKQYSLNVGVGVKF